MGLSDTPPIPILEHGRTSSVDWHLRLAYRDCDLSADELARDQAGTRRQAAPDSLRDGIFQFWKVASAAAVERGGRESDDIPW